jgi:hypothetical protein
MTTAVIENPILNSPFEDPRRHFRFTEDGITDEVVDARNLWVPAVNNHGAFGRWAFLEITAPWDAVNTMHAHLSAMSEQGSWPMMSQANDQTSWAAFHACLTSATAMRSPTIRPSVDPLRRRHPLTPVAMLGSTWRQLMSNGSTDIGFGK